MRKDSPDSPSGRKIQIEAGYAQGFQAALPRVVAMIVALEGLIALMGWLLDLPLLKSVLPGAVEMKANTAVGLILSAAALHTRSFGKLWRRQSIALALTVMALGLATLGEYLFGWRLGIDELLFTDTGNAYNAIRGRMSPLSAASFTLIGLALVVLSLAGARRLVWALSLPVTLIGMVSVLGYLWNASELITDKALPPVALNTAVAFLLLGGGIFFTGVRERLRPPETQVEGRILFGFSAAFIVLMAMGGYTYRMGADFAQSAQWVAHAQHVRVELGQIYGTISDIESSQRNVLLTGKLAYKDEYLRRFAELADRKRRLASLIADNPAQVVHVATLFPLIDRRIEILARQLAIFERDGAAAARATVSGDNGIQSMQSLRRSLDSMDAMELKLLSTRQATQEHDREVTFIGLLGTLAIAAAIFVALYLGIRREITARGKAERLLQDAAARVTAIVETVADGVITINSRGIVGTINPAGQRLFGYDAAAIIGQNVSVLMPAPYRDQHDDYLRRYLETGEARVIGIGREVTGRRKDGSTFPMYLAVNEMSLNGQRHFTGIVHDLTESKQVEGSLFAAKERAELANAAKDSFLATMSHEIRTPLTGMLGMLELLSMTPLGSEQRKTFNAAWESGRSLLRIVSDILDWSKIEEGKLDLSPQPTSISSMLQEVVNTYSQVASAKSLLVRHHVDPRLSAAHVVDGLRLSQVLNNFVSNAIKFTPGGEIELRAELVAQIESTQRIRFSVKDTGIGITEEAQEQIFDRYRQGSADTARMYGGTGLGLAICQRLAELMGGRIELVSKPGQGSTFSIVLTLPVSEETGLNVQNAHLEVQHRVVPPLLVEGQDAPLVLAVDDHPVNRDLLAQQLKLLGLRVETAENGNVALSLWRQGRFALVITDCHMPEMDGYALAKAIRRAEAERSLRHTPIIAWTANALAQEVDRCQAAGIDGLLVKPAGLAQLRSILAQHLQIAERDDQTVSSAYATIDAACAEAMDFSVLRAVVGDGASQIEVLRDFQQHIGADYASLLEMPMQDDLAVVGHMAHRMKGSCRMVGATELAVACASLEQEAADRNLTGAIEARLAIGNAVSRLDDLLAKVDDGAHET